MKRIVRGLVLSSAAGAAVYVAFAAQAEWGRVRETLGNFSWPLLGVAILLAAANYAIRFGKWDLYLRTLGLQVPRGRSLCIFLSGFTLTVTPGKMGEVVKSYLLRESDGIAMARTAPIVVAERVTDLLALLILAATGAMIAKVGFRGLLVGGVLVGIFLGFIGWRRPIRAVLGGLGRRGAKALELYDSMRALVRPKPLLAATALSVLAWACECVAFWVVIRGFPGAHATLGVATAIYASATIVGALSFLPGGLGVTEAGMTLALIELAKGMSKATAFAATFVVRLATLWFAVLVGIVALLIFQKRHHVDMNIAAVPPAA